MPPDSPPTSTKKCPKCGSSFTGVSVFCKNCGTRLTEQQNAPTVPSQTNGITTLPYAMFRANLQHTGEYDNCGFELPNILVWQFKTGGGVRSSPTVFNGVIYVGSDDKNLYAFDAVTGKGKWRFATEGGVRSSPAVVNGVVYVGSRDKNLYAIDAVTGKEKWRFETGWDVFSSPAVSNGVVYVGSKDTNLYALDAVTGKKTWRFATGSDVFSSPSVSNGIVYVGSRDKNLYAIDAVTGKEKWRFSTKGAVGSSPAVSNGVVYVGSDDKTLYAIDAVTGKEKWRFSAKGAVGSSPVVSNGVVYVGSDDKNLYAIDAVTGKEKWRVMTEGEVSSSLAVSNGVVYVGSDDNNMYAVGENIFHMFASCQTKVEKLIRYNQLFTKSLTEVKNQIDARKYDDARKILKKSEDTLDALLKCESSLESWKTEGYVTTDLETFHPKNTDELLSVFRQYSQAIHRLETIDQEFKSIQKSYPQLIEQPENARIIYTIEQNLKNPTRIDATEKDVHLFDKTLHQQLRITKLKDKSHKLLAETEQLVSIPASINTDLQTQDEHILERAIKELESLRANAKPVLAFTFNHTDLIANRWHKIGVPISNTGNSHAFDVTLLFSEEFEVKRVQPITVDAGKIVTVEFGILPKKDGTIPFEITLQYRDAIGTPFKETRECWIDVGEKNMTASVGQSTTKTISSQDPQIIRAYEFYSGYIRLKISVKNPTPLTIHDVLLEPDFDRAILFFERHEPEEYLLENEKIILGTINPNNDRTVSLYLEPTICAKEGTDVQCHVRYKDAQGKPGSLDMEPLRIQVVCPIFETKEPVNIGSLKQLIESLPSRDSKIFSVPRNLDAPTQLKLFQSVIQLHDIRHISTLRRANNFESWYYGKTKVTQKDMVIKLGIAKDMDMVEITAFSHDPKDLTGLLAEINRHVTEEVSKRGNVQKIFNISIKDSVLTRTNLLNNCDMDGKCSGDVTIADSVVTGSNIG